MTQSAGGEEGREGLFSALKNLVATLLAIGKTRAELLVTELEEEKFRLMSLWAKAIGAAFLLALGVVMVLASSLKRQASEPSKMFKGSLCELEADMAQLRRSRNKPE